MITDIDNLPLRYDYFNENIKKFKNINWINLRDWTNQSNDQICVCWQIAIPTIWSNVFNIKTIEDINIRLKKVYLDINYAGLGNNHWFTDQIDLYKYVMSWNKKTDNYIYLYDKNTDKIAINS